MALDKCELQSVMQILKDTSMRPQGEIKYPEDIVKFKNRAQVDTVEMVVCGCSFKIYKCTAYNLAHNAPLLINIHGGGWYMPHEENDLYFSCWRADKIKGVVLSVDYTTSDIESWDVMFNQCYETIKYAFDNAENLGCSKKNIVIGGFSAGGHLTAGLALKAADEGMAINKQIICYAPLNMNLKPLSEKADKNEERFYVRGKCFLDLLFRREEEYLLNSYSNPFVAESEQLKKLPATLMIMAGKCGYKAENEQYGLRMIQQGVNVTLKCFTEARHGFIPHFAECWEEAADIMAEFIVE